MIYLGIDFFEFILLGLLSFLYRLIFFAQLGIFSLLSSQIFPASSSFWDSNGMNVRSVAPRSIHFKKSIFHFVIQIE